MTHTFNTPILQAHTVFTPGLSMSREDGQPATIQGIAIVTGQECVLYECDTFREIEVIAPSCLSSSFLSSQDIKLNLLHEREYSFARSNKGKGTLSLAIRENNLHFESPVPDCDLGQRAIALISNGTYTGCSFEFTPKDYEISEREGADGKREYIITHTAFKSITALTIAMDPAYPTTSVGLRELLNTSSTSPSNPSPASTQSRESGCNDGTNEPPTPEDEKKSECKKKREIEDGIRNRSLFLSLDTSYC